ncbi:MAG: YibE/F family protein [Chloroflexi bacterium]|nr:YibE/F family protein [Chloroflexota bacterium]
MRTLRPWLAVIISLLVTGVILALPDGGMSVEERPQIEGYRGRIVEVIPRDLGPDPFDPLDPSVDASADPRWTEDPSATFGPEASIDIDRILDRGRRDQGTAEPAATDPPGSSDPGVGGVGPDRSGPDDPFADPLDDPENLPDFRVLLLEGPRAGEVVGAWLGVSTTATRVEAFSVGDEVMVSFTGQPDGVPFITVADHYRIPILAVLAIVFVAAILLVGRGQGLRALVALAFTVALVIKVVVPQILAGAPPVPVAIIVASVVTVVTIGLTEGFRRPAIAAILGTIGGLVTTGIASWLVSEAARFNVSGQDDLLFLWSILGETIDVRGLLLTGVILGALGVLDDVSVTQAAAVGELAEHAGLRGRALWSSALRVGRSHIGATVNTLFLAYVGASLPLVLLFVVAGQSGTMAINSEVVAVEVVRTLAGGLGIVAVVPITTAIATFLEDRAREPRAHAVRAP